MEQPANSNLIRGKIAMTCQDVSFREARCRVEVRRGSGRPRMFVARVSVVEDGGQTVRPLVFADGDRIEIHGSSEVLALNSAMTYLERRFGPKAEPEFDCAPFAATRDGAPFILENA